CRQPRRPSSSPAGPLARRGEGVRGADRRAAPRRRPRRRERAGAEQRARRAARPGAARPRRVAPRQAVPAAITEKDRPYAEPRSRREKPRRISAFPPALREALFTRLNALEIL